MDQHSDDPSVARALEVAHELRVLSGKLKRRLREQGSPGDLSWSQVAVLAHLEREGPATVTTLAKAEGVRPQSMGATVAMLQAAGLVQGIPDPDDGRQTILSLTDTCRDQIKIWRAAREDWLFRTIRKTLTEAEQGELARAVELLKRIVAA